MSFEEFSERCLNYIKGRIAYLTNEIEEDTRRVQRMYKQYKNGSSGRSYSLIESHIDECNKRKREIEKLEVLKMLFDPKEVICDNYGKPAHGSKSWRCIFKNAREVLGNRNMPKMQIR